jgi:hypothetical protein
VQRGTFYRTSGKTSTASSKHKQRNSSATAAQQQRNSSKTAAQEFSSTNHKRNMMNKRNNTYPMNSVLCSILVLVAFVGVLVYSQEILSSVSASDSAETTTSHIRIAEATTAISLGEHFAKPNPTLYKAGSVPGLENDRNVKVVSTSYFESLVSNAYSHKRKRKMTDITKDAPNNSLQTLINTWTNGRYARLCLFAWLVLLNTCATVALLVRCCCAACACVDVFPLIR